MIRLSQRWTKPSIWAVLLPLLLAFGFMGSRGIWDPDEGRYTNVAINMLESGDWLDPKRNDEVGHWTKPPLTYWAIASSVGVFGLNPWAARLPVALAYLVCVFLVWRLTRKLAPEAATLAALVYATMLMPFGAANIVTTDFVLAACEALAVWGFVEARWGARHPGTWVAVMWAGFALAFMTKGPPGLLPLLSVLLFDWLMPGKRRSIQFWGLMLFALLALPWYVAVVVGNPGLFEYFVGDEVVHRVTTDEFGRNGQWYGWLRVYAPTLLLGTLPWTPALWPWLRALPASVRRWTSASERQREAPMLLLSAWALLPLGVFCLARSRLPLYVLPLFAPLAILVAMQRVKSGKGWPPWPWLAVWVAVLLGLRLTGALWPTDKDAAQWAMAIQARTSQRVHEVAFVEDTARYGLRLHLDAMIEEIALDPLPPGKEARFNPRYDEDLAMELQETESDAGAIWICRQGKWPLVRSRVEALGYKAIPLGAPYRDRIIFRTLDIRHRGRDS